MVTYRDRERRLLDLVVKAERSYALSQRVAQLSGTQAAVRHKCFISYHGANIDDVTDFVEDFNEIFIPRVVGVTDSDHFRDPIDSTDEEYIKQQIGRKYLADSTVTILFVGECAWARRYIDWEISSSLRDGKVNKRNGLLAITPPDKSNNRLPDRIKDNWNREKASYARYYYYPDTEADLRRWIDDAFDAPNTRAHLIDNSRRLKQRNISC